MTGKNGQDKIPYSLKFGNAENVGHVTPRQRDLMEAIVDGKMVEYIDGIRAGGNAFPRRSHGDGGMTLRDYFASDAPIKLADAMAIEGVGPVETWRDGETKRVLKTLAELRYEYADAMLKERAK